MVLPFDLANPLYSQQRIEEMKMRTRVSMATVVLVLLVVAGFYGYRKVSEINRQSRYDTAHSLYLQKVQPQTAAFAVHVANRYLQDYSRGEFNQRHTELKRKEKVVSMFDFDIERDSFSSLLSDVSSELGMWTRQKMDEQVPRTASKEEKKEALEKLMSDNPDIDLVFKLNGKMNSLVWNNAGMLWNDVFGTEYTWEEFLDDEAEFAELQREYNELLAKID